MKAASSRDDAGFSLIEVLIGACILVVVMGAALSAQMISTGVMNETVARSHLQETAWFGVKQVAHEVRWCDPASLILSTANGSSRVDLCAPVNYVSGAPVWSTAITFRVEQSTFDWNGNGVLDEWRLVRTQDAATRVICDGLIAGGFTATRTADRVTLRLRLLRNYRGRPLTADIASIASLRN